MVPPRVDSHTNPGAEMQPITAERTGPISRVYRVMVALLLGWGVVGLVREGIAGFSEAPVPAQPVVWLMTGIALLAIHDAAQMWLAGRGRLAVIVVIVGFATAGTVAVVGGGRIWGPPLTWLVYVVDVAFVGLVAAANLLSVVLGTPGCELGALSELAQRARGSYDPSARTAHSCSGGLNRLDRWETRLAGHDDDVGQRAARMGDDADR